ncbi:class I SAM-dependent methyltransferase [Enterococcus sp. ALS3]|uniref:Class I SAM-dependent methyltransferase n=1 Tax=Enterococcus alishanensis TaxID=1303817 RepID=A0ABS6THP2_9ENTE|nr:class I SAM-dependent methyltransferase [Enterococcus alishanensis]MBV7392413.1 class I SAM-dependent methyltransferase [Enterococcus alishanensis]
MEKEHQMGWKNIISKIDNADIKNKNILDFGCNRGGFLRTLFDNYSFESGVGVDLAEKAIEVANASALNYPIQYIQTNNILSLERKFNTVISTSVLYLIEDLHEHFDKVNKILLLNGVYYASFTDQTKNPSEEYMMEQINLYGATKMQQHTLTDVVELLINYGFEVELRKEYIDNTYNVTNFQEFYLRVEDYIQSLNESYLIKATKRAESRT